MKDNHVNNKTRAENLSWKNIQMSKTMNEWMNGGTKQVNKLFVLNIMKWKEYYVILQWENQLNKKQNSQCDNWLINWFVFCDDNTLYITTAQDSLHYWTQCKKTNSIWLMSSNFVCVLFRLEQKYIWQSLVKFDKVWSMVPVEPTGSLAL